MSPSVRAECRCTTSRRRPSRPRLRSMLMIGVIPLPALTNSSRSGTSSGSTKVPSTPPRRTIVPGLASRTTYGVTAPCLQQLRRDADQPVRPAGIRGDRVRPPVMPAIDLKADAHVLPRPVALPLPARPDENADGVRRLGLDPLDPAPQLPGGPQRVDELEVVVGQQRRKERPPRPQRRTAPGRDNRSGAALSHSLLLPTRGAAHSGRPAQADTPRPAATQRDTGRQRG